jgi:hypothetical protein
MITAQILLLYILPGCGVAVAIYLADRSAGQGERAFAVLSAIFFWPIFLPGLLAGRSSAFGAVSVINRRPKDTLDRAIDQVDMDLTRALAGLEGWAGAALASETQRIHELRAAWTGLADRIREMDRVLAAPELGGEIDLLPDAEQSEFSAAGRDRILRSREIRKQNLDRLRAVRRRAFEDLMGTLAWVRELISMIHLARFTGAPAARVQELVAQIASSVEALSEVTFEDSPRGEDTPPSGETNAANSANSTSGSSTYPRETSPVPSP